MQPTLSRALIIGLLVTVPAATEAQELAGSFEQLRVLVKTGDTVRVTDGSGQDVRGSIVDLSASALSLRVNGERRTFALLRPIGDATSQDAVRELILEAYAEYEERAAVAS